MAHKRFHETLRWEGIKNTSGESCPAYGLLAITGMEMRGTTFKRPVLTGTKPSTTFYREYAVNGPTVIPAGGYGRCTRGPAALYIAYDSGTPALDEGWGPKPGQWTLSKGYPSTTTVSGIVDSTNKVLLGTLGPINTLAGKADSNIAAISTDTPTSGTVSVYYFGGTSYADTTQNVTAYNKSAAEVTASKHLTMVWVNGIWEIIFESCT